jgi:hypothetical protein
MNEASAAIVRVVDKAGAPVAGALVSVAWSTVPFPEIALVTDSNGEVRMQLAEGEYQIVAHAADGRHGSIEVAVNDGAPRATWRLVLSRSK